jgi:3D (Asp-Asp-Asp) domain-containing protein
VTLKEENKQLNIEKTKIQRDNSSLRMQIKTLNEVNTKQSEDLNKLNIQLKQQMDINSKLKSDYDKLRQERATALSKPVIKGNKEIYVVATAYTAFCNTGCTGITATGIDVRNNPDAKIVSVDPRIVPLGTKVYVEGYGYAIAGDTGGAIKGNHVDLLVRDTQTARNWGRRTVKLTILN